ncbi:unnamed protein product [Paramecium octaurelia]|uniref:Uncharacterized protein n=1 Tax=Paramecium octaurelia TaxID=43137 RepID=A0A8S1YEG2_PAROT|nr:unnamed protein product [Paramecium octaurelia]
MNSSLLEESQCQKGNCLIIYKTFAELFHFVADRLPKTSFDFQKEFREYVVSHQGQFFLRKDIEIFLKVFDKAQSFEVKEHQINNSSHSSQLEQQNLKHQQQIKYQEEQITNLRQNLVKTIAINKELMRKADLVNNEYAQSLREASEENSQKSDRPIQQDDTQSQENRQKHKRQQEQTIDRLNILSFEIEEYKSHCQLDVNRANPNLYYSFQKATNLYYSFQEAIVTFEDYKRSVVLYCQDIELYLSQENIQKQFIIHHISHQMKASINIYSIVICVLRQMTTFFRQILRLENLGKRFIELT